MILEEGNIIIIQLLIFLDHHRCDKQKTSKKQV